ncbi:MAG: hypothetical protein ACYC91_04515 [Solirubrobacteraceae bacterium]
MASPKSKRRSRKRRTGGGAPRAVPSARREQRAELRASVAPQARAPRTLGRTGERPPSPFGGLPVSEIAILLGVLALIVGWIQGGGAALIAGLIVCALGVVEVTAREHFSGYRSHATLLAAVPAVLIEVALVALVGEPRNRPLLLLAVIPVFGFCFWVLRSRFQVARQARIARPPAP